jgi:hypothetical protein
MPDQRLNPQIVARRSGALTLLSELLPTPIEDAQQLATELAKESDRELSERRARRDVPTVA